MPVSLLFILLLAFSVVCTLIVMPKIIGVVTYKRLMDNPNDRSSHTVKTPSLGGIAFFLVFSIGLLFLQELDKDSLSITFLISLIILFIIGLKDDLVVLSPLTKVCTEIFVVTLLLLNDNFQFTELHGFMGIESIPVWLSLLLSGFIMIAIINAYNLIDGIDGLAAIIGIIAFILFGALFFLLNLQFYTGLCILGAGTLLGFLRFNLSIRRKIFMGDTGSLVIGFIISILAIRLFAVEPSLLKKLPFQLENLPILIMAILIVPLFDTARVFAIRLMNRKSPFSPDRNHIHHLLIDHLKMSHKMASITLGIFNVLFVVVFIFLCANFDNLVTLGIMLSLITGLVFFFFRINFSYRNIRTKLKIKKFLGLKSNSILF